MNRNPIRFIINLLRVKPLSKPFTNKIQYETLFHAPIAENSNQNVQYSDKNHSNKTDSQIFHV